MPRKSKTIIFAGPSLTERSLHLINQYGMELRPPIERHIITDLLHSGFDGIIILVDGVFRQSLSVGHAEIRIALTRGISIWGLSSMGAIRAFEMQDLGMKGYGQVYDWFKREEDFQDDEVALLHAPTPPFQPFSEPLVHLRECIIDLVRMNSIGAEKGVKIIEQLKELYFGERTLDLFLKLLNENNVHDVENIINGFQKYRIKQLDLEKFLENHVWL